LRAAPVRFQLTPHPDFRCSALDTIEVKVMRPSPSVLSLAYRAVGRTAEVFLPPPAEPAPTDELWRTTCFEAFVKPEGGSGYIELNFAPSTRWAAYSFRHYRDGMAPLQIAPPRIEVRRAADTIELDAGLDLAVHLPPGPCRMAITAVIEATDGVRSYWGLAHPGGRPDFHHATGFAGILP
jgi:hypothetical protein